jgi:hypothetical protein
MGGTIEFTESTRNLRTDGKPVQCQGGSWAHLDLDPLPLMATRGTMPLLFIWIKE